jgi:hypothetical protein
MISFGPEADKLPPRAIGSPPDRHTASGGPERVMTWHKRLATLFVMLALAGCTRGPTSQAGALYAPHPPENTGNVPEHGGGDGGGGGGGM